jgi:hypothetical protein
MPFILAKGAAPAIDPFVSAAAIPGKVPGGFPSGIAKIQGAGRYMAETSGNYQCNG